MSSELGLMGNLYIIAGPNGAGKTTAAMTVLPEVLHVKEYWWARGKIFPLKRHWHPGAI